MTDPTPTPAALSAPVGPGQPNRPDDMRLLRHFLNAFIERGYFLQPMVALAAEGGWDDAVAKALRNVENNYFYGQADPDNKLETGDTLFQFLVQADASVKVLAASLSNETYLLATAMVPGGVDRIKRTISKKQVQVNGHAKRVQEVHEERITGHIRTYLPEVLKALTRKQLNDVDMLMMALGTIRAESAAFQPMDEGRSKFNTSPVGTKGRHAFDLYDFRADLGHDAMGDGALYKGRGFVQLTGRANYQSVGKQIGVNLLDHPDRANEPGVAADVLAQFLKNHEAAIRAALKINDLKKARRLVNGGSHGLDGFKLSFAAGRRYLGIAVAQHAKQAIKRKQPHATTKPVAGPAQLLPRPQP